MFATTAEFLPQHRQQLDATRLLIDRAAHDGQERMVEMNRTVESNLLRIITSLEAPANTSDTISDSADEGAVRAG